jgi:hypothetical protein
MFREPFMVSDPFEREERANRFVSGEIIAPGTDCRAEASFYENLLKAKGSGDFSPLWSGQTGCKEMPAAQLTRDLAAPSS